MRTLRISLQLVARPTTSSIPRHQIRSGTSLLMITTPRPSRPYIGQYATVSSPTVDSHQQSTTLYFTIGDKVGALDDALRQIRGLNISLTSIESRPSRNEGEYDFFCDFVARDSIEVDRVVKKLKEAVKKVMVVSSGSNDAETSTFGVPWFPRRISDLDKFVDRVLSYGAELEADHPGFKDTAYRKRRAEITRLAREHRHGNKLPHVEELQYVLPLLVQNCGYRNNNIPQLETVSNFLKDCTGWTLRPVMGLLSSRDFLNALAFRVFHSTQYIRHSSKPRYTPEPDVCHELLGHVPLYADPDFADFSQEIGLASLGATDEDINKLATIYWFTVEFGLCRQGDEIKAYGAGLLSSFGELEYCLTEKSEKIAFDAHKAAIQTYPITEYQPVYFVAESFSKMKDQVREYASSLSRPFTARYSALTQSVEVLDSRAKLMRFAKNIQSDLSKLMVAIDKTTV
ncbi:hypothetical protein SeMB42_g01253 [Synchytrium endobioticum]|uniref:phenylalanine 4-monooxygenase n=1 Tax=Synchytrium endobioticum TaxID=286115 RepID=A0A507DP84_9FUNG|nr:hypothetical protein SeLEV6574_g01655 [Synchytrium endobioticum]TPX52690.1 hypothetical protein SeMB42_g01253 [Synchytrium endobioticum]